MILLSRILFTFLVFCSVLSANSEPPQSDFITLPQGIIARKGDVNLDAPASWGKYPPTYYWGDTTVIDLKQKPLLFLTHHSAAYDPAGVAERGGKSALDSFLASKLPVFYLYSFRFASESTFRFLDYYKKFAGVESEGGENTLRYKGGRNFFFTGGHLSMCLCETIRDTVRNVTDASPTEPTHFYFINEGIYDVGKNLKDHAKTYLQKGQGYEQLILDMIIRNSTTPNSLICGQNWKKQPEVFIKDFTIEVIGHDGENSTLSQGKKGLFIFHLIDSSEVEGVIKNIAAAPTMKRQYNN